jgi:hypothetical protein
VKKLTVQEDESFIDFLRELLGVGDDAPGRADKVGVALARHLQLESAYERLSDMKWNRARGGFKVPEGVLNFGYFASKTLFILTL